ncbi:uncharacterized protein LOC113775541 [Coffea eugenioides]|nr:uncharacterized protein LOC113775541 [Coffea eugenioides]
MGTSNPSISTPPTFSSSFSAAARSSIVKQKQVFLHEWWLEKAHPSSAGRRLSVGGCTERLGTRIFHSSAVLKRYDTVTLGTADGILVKICGAINKSRTHENGFPLEVCFRFLYGFPFDWEEFANQSFAEESTNRAILQGLSNLDGHEASSVDGLNRFSPKSFDDLPVALLRDFSDSSVEYSATCELWKSTFKDILQKYGDSVKDHAMTEISSEEETPRKQKNSKGEHDISIRKDRITKDQVMAESSSVEIPNEHEKSMVKQNNKREHDMPKRRSRRIKLQNFTLDKSTSSASNVERKGPRTRSSTQNSTSKHEESVSVTNAGNTVFNGTEITRKLKLRNRFVEVHVKRIQ